MIWLTWRQHRAQILVTVAALTAFAALLLISGWSATNYIAEHAPPGCPAQKSACAAVNSALQEQYWNVYNYIGFLPIVFPALIGAFWGAPLLAREYERGTHKLAWTQSMPQRRWMVAKLATLSIIVVAIGGVFAFAADRWLSIFTHTQTSDSAFNNPGKFALIGLAPPAWALFGFAAGVAAGALFRRVIPAMAVTVVAVGLTFPLLVSLHDDGYATPETVRTDSQQQAQDSGGILVDAVLIDPSGSAVDTEPQGLCAAPEDSADLSPTEHDECLAANGYQWELSYQPAERFWRFQLTDAALLTGLSVAFGVLTLLRTGKR